MMDQAAIESYLAQMPFTDRYDALFQQEKDKIIFGAWESLKRKFGESILTAEMGALQTLFMFEGEREEFSKFKRHGLTSVGFDGNSLAFDQSRISPDVMDLIDRIKEEENPTNLKPLFGRLR